MRNVFTVICIGMLFGCSGGDSNEHPHGDDDLVDSDSAIADMDGCGSTTCGNDCVDIRVDPNNCGGCGYVCDRGLSCIAGACTLICPLERTGCNGTCVDTTNDDANCGACGVSCGAGSCQSGTCSPECKPGELACADTCIDPTLDEQHCGACSIACEAGDSCQQGRCCTPSVNCNSLPILSLPIIVLADWRGEIVLDDDDPGTDSATAMLAAYVSKRRQEVAGTLVLATGLFGLPSRVTLVRPASAIEVMNQLELDAAGLTTADLERDTAFIAAIADGAEFPLVAPENADISHDLLEVRAPFVILPTMGRQVSVIDVTRSGGDPLDLAAAALFARDEAEANGADTFVLLTDLETVRATTSATAAGPLYVLAKATRGFHLIVGQSSRGAVDAVSINGQLVVQTYNRARGVTDVSLILEGAGPAGSSTAARIDDAFETLVPDPTMEAMLATFESDVASLTTETVGSASVTFPFTTATHRSQETAIGDLVADAAREACGSQIALVNAGVIRAGFAQGAITLEAVLAASALDDAVVIETITGAQLWAALENGLSRLPDSAGRFPQISGFSFSYDSADTTGQRVRSVTLDDGRSIKRDDNRYSIAITEFISDGGDGYATFVEPQRQLCDSLTRILLEYAKGHSPLTPASASRIEAQ